MTSSASKLYKILLIDDEELVIKSLEKFLRKEGFEVTSVKSGEEALKQIGKQDFDLIITDIRMPGINGIDLIERIRSRVKQKGCPSIPEICITGYADDELGKRAEDLGVADYLYKPFDLMDFLNCIRKHLKVKTT